MRYEDAAARLEPLPDPLPPPLEALLPVRTDGGTWRPPDPGALPGGRPAAVLVLVHPDDAGDARVVLIERPTHDGHHHSGEVSFPGGKAEPTDIDAAATALREAAEEVGLDTTADAVRVVGRLDPLWIPVSDFAVTPIVAVTPRRPRLVPSPAEVVRIVAPPVATFLPGAPIVAVERTIRGWAVRYGQYEVEGLKVWGATARILSQLGAVLAGSDQGAEDPGARAVRMDP